MLDFLSCYLNIVFVLIYTIKLYIVILAFCFSDIFDSLLAPHYQTDLYSETWQNDKPVREPSTCINKYKVEMFNMMFDYVTLYILKGYFCKAKGAYQI